MRSWIQAFCAALVMCIELNAERLAVGTFATAPRFTQAAVFEAEDVIEERFFVEVGLGEAVGTGIKLLTVARRLDAERVELGVEMAAHA